MKPTIIFVFKAIFFFATLHPGISCARQLKFEDHIPAFYGAEGFGANTPGGRGGIICEVTNLNDAGTGSLRECLSEKQGPRIVVFRTGGTIELSSPVVMSGEDDSFVTVAGQTAPGGGIQIKNHGIIIKSGAHDIVIRYLRIRPGNGSGQTEIDTDAIEIWGNTSTSVKNIVVDHVSMEWAMDENISVWGNVSDITIQYCIIAEARKTGQNNEHAKGMLIGGPNAKGNISIHHNLFAQNPDRSPRSGAPNHVDFVNNIIYNWGNNNNTMFGDYENLYGSMGTQVNLINNFWKKGTDSSPNHNDVVWVKPKTKIYLKGNRGPKCPSGCSVNEWDIGIREEVGPSWLPANEIVYRSPEQFETPAITTYETSQAIDSVLKKAGAIVPSRDAVDIKIVNDVKNDAGSLTDNNPYPVLAAGTPPMDTDGDGMPDEWEMSRGLDPNDNSDQNGDINGDGYTNIEKYLGERAGDVNSQPITFAKKEKRSPKNNFKVFPNPCYGKFRIESASQDWQLKNVDIVTMRGQVVARINPETKIFDVSALSDGMYFIRLESAGKNTVCHINNIELNKFLIRH
ncbi:MAG: T9SS type A sorting domain-containing protein [Prolixibacteraceae bacterium]|jgi:hypothetical protein|nr:T9SS type A sorting domain-containing protein [Prolixibacteraceae bacterium]